jgi:nicotinate-nucleotide adenylyltransferase
LAFKSAPVRFGSIRPKPPLASPGQRIGLLGGSFNPPHEAHKLITETALRRLQLDAVWWMVTPGNPLKSHSELASLEHRLGLCRDMTGDDPRIKITDFEKDLPTAYTAASLSYLQLRFRQVHFVWLMGADNLASFHNWEQWRSIAAIMPIAVVDRPNWRLTAMGSPAARFMQRFYKPEAQASVLATTPAPAWMFMTGPLSDLSSTAIRRAMADESD